MTEHNIVSVSGGKDSTALLLLAKEQNVENLQAVFADTGHEHPATIEYVAYLNENVFPIRTIKADFSKQIERKREVVQTKWRKEGVEELFIERALSVLSPTGNPFLDLCLWKGRFPSTRARFCSEELKRNPIINQVQKPLLNQGDDIISWQGVRADESANRRNLPELEIKLVYDNGAELWNYRPILKWTAEDCFSMHKKHGIKHNPLYEQGMGRVGCMPCIHARKDELLEISKRFSAELERVSEWEALVSMAAKRGKSTFFSLADNHGDGVWQVVEWSKTARGGKQIDLLRVESEVQLCTSIYGLCE